MTAQPRTITLDDLATRPDDAAPAVLRVDGARVLLADRDTHDRLVEVVDLDHGLCALYVRRVEQPDLEQPQHVVALDDPAAGDEPRER